MSKRRKTKAKSDDFVNWDDTGLDLDALLGEHTDYENEFDAEIEIGEWDDECNEMVTVDEVETQENDAPKKEKKRKREACHKIKPTSVVKYKCRECNKEVKTISGIRGHMLTQHNIRSVRAADYRIGVGAKQDVAPPAKRPLSDASEFLREMPGIAAAALLHIAETSLYAKSKTPMATAITHTAKTVSPEDVAAATGHKLHIIISKLDDGITMAAGREAMYTHFHDLKIDTDFVGKISEACHVEKGKGCAQHFIQVLLMELLNQTIARITQLCQEKTVTTKTLDEVDQEVVYYIAGYIVRKVKTKGLPEADKFIKEAEVTRETHSSFKDKFSGWTSDLDRGGLLMASDSMFLFVRSMENVMQKRVDTSNLAKSTLIADDLREAIMEDFLVKHHFDKLACSQSTSSSSIVLEFCVMLYQRLRGNAISKYVRRHLMKLKGDKKQKALRKSLKDMSNSK